MDVINNTPFPHHLFRGSLSGDIMIASLAIKVTYNITGQGKAVVAENQVWPCSGEPQDTEYGPMESDDVFKRGGVDILILGKAKAPQSIPVQRMQVQVNLPGKVDHTVMVIGNRIWKSSLFGLTPSDPEYFTEMPLTVREAFGGEATWDELPIPHPVNSLGKGFIWEKENAKGIALPNMEHPSSLISRWNDRPTPVGIGPIKNCENKIKRAVQSDSQGNITNFDPVYFNNAFNELIVPEVLPGETIHIKGMTENGTFLFEIPDHRLNIQLTFGENDHLRSTKIEQVGIEVEKQTAFITYRYSFQYTLRPGEKRTLEIKEEK